MIKLFIHNKLTEIANWIYTMWNDDILSKYIVITILGCIPCTLITYLIISIPYINLCNNNCFLRVFIAFELYMVSMCMIYTAHVVILSIYKWIKHNIELAKNGIKIDPKWK